MKQLHHIKNQPNKKLNHPKKTPNTKPNQNKPKEKQNRMGKFKEISFTKSWVLNNLNSQRSIQPEMNEEQKNLKRKGWNEAVQGTTSSY